MALYKCKECGNDVSTKAPACPSCGALAPKKTSILTWVATVAASVVVVSCIIGQDSARDRTQAEKAKKAQIEAAKSPAQKASEAAAAAFQEKEFQFAVVATKLARASMKNPASFEFVDAGLVDKGALCLTYRGTNSFNAVITQQVAITRVLQKGEWNRDCAGRSITPMNYIRQAI